jgi:CheY-like chemotaxis protein
MALTWSADHGTNLPENTDALRILIAEDMADCAESTALLLRLHGHEVTVARDGPTALRIARTYRPDVLLLDIGLPGMSGYEVAARMKDQHREKKPFIIAVTGFGQPSDRQRSAQFGIDLHLLKPVDPQYLERVLRRFQALLYQHGT